MAFNHGTLATLEIDPAGGSSYTDISTYLEEASETRKTDSEETTTLGNTAKTYIPGLESGTFKLKGFFDPTFDALFNSIRRTIVTFRYRPAGAGTGLPQFTGTAFLMTYDVDAKVSDVVSVKADFQITGAVTRGVQ